MTPPRSAAAPSQNLASSKAKVDKVISKAAAEKKKRGKPAKKARRGPAAEEEDDDDDEAEDQEVSSSSPRFANASVQTKQSKRNAGDDLTAEQLRACIEKVRITVASS